VGGGEEEEGRVARLREVHIMGYLRCSDLSWLKIVCIFLNTRPDIIDGQIWKL
jgi:hypothetical protein